jgi:hypothetical protein
MKKRYGPKTELGQRRHRSGRGAVGHRHPIESLVEREPATVILLGQGLDPRMKGHVEEQLRSSSRKATAPSSS